METPSIHDVKKIDKNKNVKSNSYAEADKTYKRKKPGRKPIPKDSSRKTVVSINLNKAEYEAFEQLRIHNNREHTSMSVFIREFVLSKLAES